MVNALTIKVSVLVVMQNITVLLQVNLNILPHLTF
jgi:hypothetical protein